MFSAEESIILKSNYVALLMFSNVIFLLNCFVDISDVYILKCFDTLN